MDDLKFKGYIVKRAKGEPSILNGGFLKIDPASADYAQDALNKLKNYDGRELDIMFTDEQGWTNSMNRLFHALIRKLRDSGLIDYWDLRGRSPETFSEIKDWVKVELGYAEVNIVGRYMHIQSWKEFSKKKACNTIDNVINWMLDKGINVDSEKLEYQDLKGGK